MIKSNRLKRSTPSTRIPRMEAFCAMSFLLIVSKVSDRRSSRGMSSGLMLRLIFFAPVDLFRACTPAHLHTSEKASEENSEEKCLKVFSDLTQTQLLRPPWHKHFRTPAHLHTCTPSKKGAGREGRRLSESKSESKSFASPVPCTSILLLLIF